MHYIALVKENADRLASAIGTRVKRERQSRKLTLDALAEAAGVSRRMLVNIEQGAANPSVGTLLRISDALGVSLPSLVEPPRLNPVIVTRHGDGSVLWQGEHGGTGVLVAATESPNVVELWDWSLAPGDRHDSEPHSTGTRELLQVQEGSVTFAIGEQIIILQARDSMSYPGDIAHSYVNSGPDAARFTLSVYEPRIAATNRTELPQ